MKDGRKVQFLERGFGECSVKWSKDHQYLPSPQFRGFENDIGTPLESSAQFGLGSPARSVYITTSSNVPARKDRPHHQRSLTEKCTLSMTETSCMCGFQIEITQVGPPIFQTHTYKHTLC